MDANTNDASRRRGEPRDGVPGRQMITRKALEIVSEHGHEALTISGLARALGVTPAAVHNHASSKQELLQWVQEEIMAGVDASAFCELPLDEALRRWARSYRDVFVHHAPLIPVIAVLPVGGSPRTLRMYESVARGFAAAGWPDEEIVDAIVALESFIFGSALDATAPLDIFDPGPHAASIPTFGGALRARRHPGRQAADAAFQQGLEAMIAGLLAAPAG
jgi:AcrR family transcriptional regulator